MGGHLNEDEIYFDNLMNNAWRPEARVTREFVGEGYIDIFKGHGRGKYIQQLRFYFKGKRIGIDEARRRITHWRVSTAAIKASRSAR